MLQLLTICGLMAAQALAIAPKSSLVFGEGYEIVFNRDTPVYPKNLDQNSMIKSISKYENHTFYLYHDRKSEKFYVRDESCRFLCLNPCGVAYMSNVIVKHYCKFKIEEKSGLYRLYIPSSGASLKKVTYRYLSFDVSRNVVNGVLNLHNPDLVPYEVKMENKKTNQTGCTKIGKMVALNFDAKESSRCSLPKVSEMTPAEITKDIQVVSSVRYFYHLKLPDGYVTSSASLNPMMGDYSRFHKEMVNTNAYVFRNTDTCDYLCMNKCGVVYMSLIYNTDCKLRIQETTAVGNVYLKFERHHYYLSVDSQGFLSNSTHPTYRNQVQLQMTEMDNTQAYDKKCGVIRTDTSSETDDSCVNVANRIGRSLLSTLFVYFVVKNNDGVVL